MKENYNQHKANLTGDTYYQVTCEAFWCNLWAVDEDNARHLVYSFWPDLLGKELTVRVIVEPDGEGNMRKKMHRTDDYPVLLVKEQDYVVMEVELYEGRIVIQPIYTASSAGEAKLIMKTIKELDPVAKYYVKAVERK